MKERPILFSGPMVRAILDGRKTVTRRVVKLAPDVEIDGWDPTAPHRLVASSHVEPTGTRKIVCPYGEPGDRLWVKETWGLCSYTDDTDFHRGSVRGLGGDSVLKSLQVNYQADWGRHQESCFWRPSIHMPRWVARLLAEVVDVRAERLREITAKDILAEGVVLRWHQDPLLGKCPISAFDGKMYVDLMSLWRAGWDDLNAKRGFGWTTNPWVWRVEFKRIEAANG